MPNFFDQFDNPQAAAPAPSAMPGKNFFDQFDNPGGNAAASSSPEAITPETGLGPVDAFNAFTEQFGRAATMGLQDKVGALVPTVNAAVARGFDYITGQPQGEVAQPGKSLSDIYHGELANERAAGDTYAQNHPIASKVATTAGTVATVPLTAAGEAAAPVSLGGKILQGGKQGAALGGISGFGNSNDESLKQDALNTGTGAALGAAAGAAIPVAVQAVSPVTQAIARKVLPGAANSQALDRFVQAVRQDEAAGGPGLEQIAAKLAAANGQPLAIRDVGGENVAGLGGQVTRIPGPGREAATAFLENRDLAAGPRIVTGPLSDISTGPDAYTATKALIVQRSADSAPAYDAAFANSKPVDVQPIADDINSKIAQAKGGIKTALQKAGSYLLDANGDLDTSLEGLHQSKLAIDDLINGASDTPVGRNAKRLLVGVQNKLVNAMDAASTDANGNSLYAQARNLYAGPSQLMDAMELGQKFTALHPNAIADQLNGMSDGEKQAFLLGAKDALVKSVLQKGPAGNEALAVAKNGWMRQQLRPLFPSDSAYNNFLSQIENEGLMFKTMRQDIGGSDTARRIAQDQGEGGGGTIGNAIQSALSFAEGAHGAGTYGAIRTLGSLLRGGSGVPSREVAAELAPMLYNSDPAANRMLLARALQRGALPSRQISAIAPLAAALGRVPPAALEFQVPYLSGPKSP